MTFPAPAGATAASGRYRNPETGEQQVSVRLRGNMIVVRIPCNAVPGDSIAITIASSGSQPVVRSVDVI